MRGTLNKVIGFTENNKPTSIGDTNVRLSRFSWVGDLGSDASASAVGCVGVI
jgi:hypothetical protein